MKKKLYTFLYIIIWPFFNLIYPTAYRGRENIPEGAALFCGNHTAFADPLLAAYATGRKGYLHFMAKVEVLRVPVLGPLLRILGVFGVNRDQSDIGAVKHTLTLLKTGEKVMLFPQGTRVKEGMPVEAKSGAVRIALSANVPVIPMFVPEKKRLFRRNLVIIGKPYYIPSETKRPGHEQSKLLAQDIMKRIYALGGEYGLPVIAKTEV